MSTTPRSRMLKATSTWDSDTAQETNNQDKEIQRRITAGWTAFAKHLDIFKGNIGTCLKRHVYNSWVFPAITYMVRKHGHSPSKQVCVHACVHACDC
ncbi:hypothetical protein NP493_1312g00000 [Ridgeia piscesae]|uniref:Uncharacterized protein n=1 Tax=Ridgeia piscesae TaxID=27915 RepID=A0AAD9NE69_RIDPI|nr:hypothetical protein NP493_1312g00000 [Ridgeia piscesae]